MESFEVCSMSDVLANRRIFPLSKSRKWVNIRDNPSTLSNSLLICASCFVGVEVVLGFKVDSEKGLDELESASALFSICAGRSELDELLLAELDSVALESFAELFEAFDESKLIFWEKLVSFDFSLARKLAFGGDCDLCEGESGAVSESSSAFDIIP
jgi:hypothetical protein